MVEIAMSLTLIMISPSGNNVILRRVECSAETLDDGIKEATESLGKFGYKFSGTVIDGIDGEDFNAWEAQ
jgi:hypothetical protein